MKETHGNIYQSGLPDIYAAHIKYGARWIEMKTPGKYRFTPAQLEFFPQLASVGIGVWILVDDSDDEYYKLWQPPNWWQYMETAKAPRTRTVKKEHGYKPKFPTPGLKDKK